MLYQSHNSIGQNYFECLRYVDFKYVPHMHRHPELVRVVEGEVTVHYDGKTERVPAGEYALIPPNIVHAYETAQHSLVDVCIFSQAYAPAFFREIQDKRLARTRFTCRESVADFTARELFVTDHIPDFYTLKSTLYAVLGEFLSCAVFEATGKSSALMEKVVRYIAENYTEDITLSSMAAALGYEQHYLSRCFHALIPMHFSRYVNWYRVDAATELLHNTDLSITEIALRSGFQSIRSFNRVYLDLTGQRPSRAAGKNLAGNTEYNRS